MYIKETILGNSRYITHVYSKDGLPVAQFYASSAEKSEAFATSFIEAEKSTATIEEHLKTIADLKKQLAALKKKNVAEVDEKTDAGK